MTRSVAIEAAPFKIRINAICPAAMPQTNFGVHDPTKVFQEKPAEQVTAIGNMHPLGQPITPEDCAEAALFLASDRSRNITGILLPVDGGFIAR